MHSVSNLAKRLFAAGSLMLLAACGSAGPMDPTADQSSAPQVSAALRANVGTTTTVKPVTITTTTTVTATPAKPTEGTTTNSGYNVTAF